jgi:hypothetical protein
MSDGRVYRPSAPVNASPEMSAYYNREAERVMGYRFERPSSRGMIIRRPTPAERAARDRAIAALREERGGVERIAAAQAHSAACFAAARVNAVAALARCARLRKGSGKRNPEAHTSAPDSVPTVVGSLNQEDGK